MQFNTLGFFVFFAICLCLYYRVPAGKNKWLMAVFGVFFYSCFSYSGLLVLGLVSLISWCGERVLSKVQNRYLLWLFSGLTLSGLVLLKYFNVIPGFALPVGISFFTLQAVSAMGDVYRKKSVPTGLGEHVLYLSFFPTVVSGPILRKNDFLKEVKKEKVFVYEDVRRGFYRIAIGFVEKYFLADRISRLVDSVYGQPSEFGGAQIAVATILFGLQLYYDFAGYSHMAIGFAKCFGISIMENFERPYFSCSIKEFWRRWHISLSSWLRDYVYIPLGGSRNGTGRKYANLVITFLVSGIWHGVGLNYLFWGFLHGFYQVVEDGLFGRRKGNMGKQQEVALPVRNAAGVLFRMLAVFLLVNFAWLFFRAPDMGTAVEMVNSMVTKFQISGLFSRWWFDYGMAKVEYLMWAVVSLAVLVFDIMEEKDREFLLKFEKQNTWIRWSVYTVVLCVIVFTLLIGMGSNANSFLYQNF